MKKNHHFINTLGIGTIVLLLVAASGFYMLTAHAQELGGGIVPVGDTVSSDAEVVAVKFVRQVEILNGVKIDESLFGTRAFTSLVDWGRPLPEEEAGRTNPFAPF